VITLKSWRQVNCMNCQCYGKSCHPGDCSKPYGCSQWISIDGRFKAPAIPTEPRGEKPEPEDEQELEVTVAGLPEPPTATVEPVVEAVLPGGLAGEIANMALSLVKDQAETLNKEA
jgi:hypothetical protein